MKNLSLYDILVGQFSSESKNIDETDLSDLDDLTEEQKLRSSIIENLRMVLSTRQGSVQHLPDFGMPDILQLYFNSDNSSSFDFNSNKFKSGRNISKKR